MTALRPKRALVVGAGISGMATALRLSQVGWEPLVVERSPTRRTGGYFTVFMADGFEPSRRLGVIDGIRDRADPQGRFLEMDRRGRLVPGMNPAAMMPMDPSYTVLRGDVEKALYDALRPRAEIRFGVEPLALRLGRDHVEVDLTDGVTERFDLVVGADGMHSTIREQVFGPEDLYRRDFNHVVAACLLDRPLPWLRAGDNLLVVDTRRSVAVQVFRDHDPVAMFMYCHPWPAAEIRKRPAAALREVYGDFAGPVVPDLLDALERAESTLFDQISQIHLSSWSRGRVVLVGDSAWSLTLYSGFGSSLGIAGGELLGTLLAEHGDDVAAALGTWEHRLRPVVTKHQKSAHFAKNFLLPPSSPARLLRRAVVRTAASRAGGKLFQALLPASRATRAAGASKNPIGGTAR
ncbi:2-polyprenyl-6-methoxyphenol hydroxylase-like FAD-dependent oxidoreductase [Saccharothrix ecbatanensis]|jgi:2-polyprenyl-6-methoxyphenol hydroxylase-like FAD-dependent oxidoreductase|uniref:2-polyprenyl-6-methoxyphenol hydroxylase-like FAD-dependent oxidoreductase n=1 Tax=Saccharothrix ecbatanensis TaxID=1105145 RepID=A0A7W9HJ29_9PSEU|nr:FAD-dependent monooxygenase [Saccharothrix ecbatanensis]MBB5803222.1 2-polyprenyl-6-methoxyphenol hydroxylase-like FAD-dependent oxidoreductase [Saccharothrix ecbatanensis]